MYRTLLICCVILTVPGCDSDRVDEPAPANAGRRSGLKFLQNDGGEGFARAIAPRHFGFPEDHGSHPEYRTEWWYLTGNLEGPGRRRLGFQLTFFRFGLGGSLESGVHSAWRVQQTWMAHLAVLDETSGRFVAHERMAREALGLAGAGDAALRVWVEDWSLRSEGAADALSLRLAAGDSDVALELRITGGEAPVLQGDAGLDRKGPEEGNASYYYSVPGLRVEGTVRLGDGVMPVQGMAWLDREWGTSALSAEIVGWDWFALQFDQGGSLMYYRLRDADGRASPYSGGTLIAKDGERIRLGAEDVRATPQEYWLSDRTLRRYPVGWRLEIPGRDLSVGIRPWQADQELELSVRYWEGAVDAVGTEGGEPLQGRGYVELTGY